MQDMHDMDWLQRVKLIMHSFCMIFYHIKPDGIMTIVLPHGVLFRGGEEGIIRKI